MDLSALKSSVVFYNVCIVLAGNTSTSCKCYSILFIIIATECGDLQDPRNGRVSISGYIVYSVATYKCDSGFGIKGAVTRMCKKDGTWSGSDPTCERTLYHKKFFN